MIRRLIEAIAPPSGRCLSAVLPVLFIALAVLHAPASAEDFEVGSIRVEGLRSMGKEELLYLLELREGEAVDREALRRGLKRAFRKGMFEDISVEAEDAAKGLVVVRVKEKDVIRSIRVRGNSDVGDRFIKSRLGMKTDEYMRYDLLEKNRMMLLQAIREKGYPDATVDIEVRRTRRPYGVSILVRVDEGRPLYVKEINVFGRPKEEVLGRMALRENSVYDQFVLRKDIERLKKHYRKQKYLDPVVGPYTFSDGVLHINVLPGKRLKIRTRGNDSISARKLMKAMPFYDAGDVRDDLVDEAVSRLTALYHEKGFPDVQVAPVMSREGAELTLSFYFYEGTRVRVGAINITGVSVPEENLKGILSLRENKPYNPDLLESDARAIRDFYNALGYLDVVVSDPVVAIEDALATITIKVEEGAQTTIREIALKGISSLSEADVRAAMGLEAGAPYNEVDISDARRRMLSLYRKNGFQGVSIDVTRDFDAEGGAEVVFEIDEGEKSFFGITLVTGNRRTNIKVIQRELIHIEGEPVDSAKLLVARQNIYKLGLFKDVDISLKPRKDRKQDVVVALRETEAGTFDFGFGYGEYDKFRGFFDLTYKNLFGMNRQLAFRTEFSSLWQRYTMRYNEPWFLGVKIPMRAYFLYEDRKEKNIDTGNIRYRVERYTAGLGVEKELSDKVKLDLLYEFSFTDTTEVDPDILLSKEDTGTLAISSITPSLTYDTRDNPFDPKRGVFAGVSLKVATVALLSETDFFKLVAFQSRYFNPHRRVVIATSVRGGVAEGLRETSDLPLIERFFLGGRNTVRGFEQDTLGPKSTDGVPIGGNVFFLSNIELRCIIAKNWRVALFWDSGAVWLGDNDVNFKDIRNTIGAGIQYNTPVGPIRLDYGHKLDRRYGESKGAVHFSIGYAF